MLSFVFSLQCQVGDWVTIKLCRPVSKSKKFAVVQVNGKKTMAEEILQQELLDRRGETAAYSHSDLANPWRCPEHTSFVPCSA